MSILGPHEIQDFLNKLDERTLLDVCTDILSIEGHKNIRIMDGPGDGQRDIHSIDINGNKCLTQSKYHSDLSHSVSAKELGEVVLGMVRLGYKHGLFITSTKISPQAKRDCLNDYPGYSIDFWDGREIVKKVFDNLVIKAIWYDGHSLNKIAYTLIVPIIARDLETDKPLQLLPEQTVSLAGNRISIGRSEIQINYQKSFSSSSVFQNYRPPKRKTISEFGASKMSITEAILSGIIHLDDIDSILDNINKEALTQTISSNPKNKHFAIIFGTPTLTPLGGESSGARIELEDYSGNTIVVHEDFTADEIAWITPLYDSREWILPDSPGVSQAAWIRWYSPIYDTCLDIYILCPPNEGDRWEFIEQRDYFVKWWNNSLFMLVPSNLIGKWEKYELKAPAKCLPWDNSLFLCSWLHPVFNHPLVQLSMEPEYEDATPQFPEQDLKRVKQDLEKIKRKLESLGSSNVDSQKARYMFAVLEGKDPYPDFENIIYQGKHLAYYPDKIPTPIEPNSRRFQFTICWKIESKNQQTTLQESDLFELVSKLKSIWSEDPQVKFFADSETIFKSMFILCEIEFKAENIYLSTDEAVRELMPRVIKLVEGIESNIGKKAIFVRATKEYWNKELLMMFKENQEE